MYFLIFLICWFLQNSLALLVFPRYLFIAIISVTRKTQLAGFGGDSQRWHHPVSKSISCWHGEEGKTLCCRWDKSLQNAFYREGVQRWNMLASSYCLKKKTSQNSCCRLALDYLFIYLKLSPYPFSWRLFCIYFQAELKSFVEASGGESRLGFLYLPSGGTWIGWNSRCFILTLDVHSVAGRAEGNRCAFTQLLLFQTPPGSSYAISRQYDQRSGCMWGTSVAYFLYMRGKMAFSGEKGK